MEKISYEHARGKADSLRKSAATLENVFDEVKTEIGKIGTDDTWKSDAATEYLNKFNSLSAKFPDFIQKVQDCATFIDSTVDAYVTSDSKIGQSADEYLSS